MDSSNNTPKGNVNYWDYLGIDTLLSLQQPVTTAHDEFQFIIVHQTFELWFRLAIHELRAAISTLRRNDPHAATPPLKRVISILNTAVHGFDPLITMSRESYLSFRDALAPASGFQSVQFRMIEILLGIKRLPPEPGQPEPRFYWESAVQAGQTFTSFADKYYDQLLALAEECDQNNVHDLMLLLTEQATSKTGEDAYRHLLANPQAHPDLATLATIAHNLQAAILNFRSGHHVVTRYSIGDASGTSDSHTDPVNSSGCADYLMRVIKNHTIVFPELENAYKE